MSIQYLYDSSGDWIAVRNGKYIFNTDGDWIGWMPWEDDDVVNIDGYYMGSICSKDRFYFFQDKAYLGYPCLFAYPGFPKCAGSSPLPPGAQDIKELKNR